MGWSLLVLRHTLCIWVLIHAGDRDVISDAVDHQQKDGEQHLVPQFRNPENVEQCLKHA